VLLINPVEYDAAEFSMTDGWGNGLEVVAEGGVDTETLSFSVVSLEDEDAAAALQVALTLTRANGGEDVAIRFQLGSMQLKSEYKNHGHKLDLAAGACWLAQDIATSLYLSAPQAKITVRVETLTSSEEDDALGANFTATLEGVRAAMQAELDDEF